MKDYAGQQSHGRRSSRRVKLTIATDIVKDARPYSFGHAVDISRDGAAIDSQASLVIGETYRYHFRGFGVWPGKVVRRIGSSRYGTRYGVQFDIDETQKRQIDGIIRKLLENAPANDREGSLVVQFPDSKIRSF